MGYVLGVDLGTTYSAAAVADGDRCDIVQLGSRAATIPSLVFLRDDGEMLVGEAAERRAAIEPARTGREFKRRLGDPAPMLLGGTPFSAEALMAHLLRSIVQRVTEERGEAPQLLAVTHPASFGEYKLDLMRQMVRQAGCDAVTFLPEPVAAAVHYASQERIDAGSAIAVYDFGGGTFDAAVLRKTESGFEILGQPEGLERLGGIDFDEAVFAHVAEVVGRAVLEGDGSPAARSALSRLRDECRDAKESLSTDTEATIPVLMPAGQSEVRLTRGELEDVVRPRVRETVAVLERSVKSAGMTLEEIDRVLLVGGSSRIPLVGQVLREMTGRPISRDSHPKHTIALGAALLAQAMTRTTEGYALPAARIPQPAVDPVVPAIPEVPAPVPTVVEIPAQNAPDARPVAAAALRTPSSATTVSASQAAETTGRGRLPRWVWGAAGLVIILAAAAGLAIAFGGGAVSAKARITDAQLSSGVYTVWFNVDGVSIANGDSLVFYWDNAEPENGATWTGGSPVSFTFQRPAGAAKICIAVAPASGTIKRSSGNCWTV